MYNMPIEEIITPEGELTIKKLQTTQGNEGKSGDIARKISIPKT